MLKKLIPFIIVLSMLAPQLYAAWKFNPHTGKLDYYMSADELEVEMNTSGVTAVGDCVGGACYDGSSDGGTYIRLYDGNSHYSALVAGDSTGNLTWTFPTAAAAGNNYLLRVSTAGAMSTVDPASFESHTSNDIDVDRLASDTTDDNLIDAAIINWISPSGISLVDSSPDGSGEMGYAANVFTLFANSEDLTLTAGSNLWTFNSSTGATFAFTPALAPTILNLPSSNASPGTTAGQIRHDSTVTGLTTGALAWWDGDEVRYIVDLDVLPSDNGYYVQYNSSDGKFVMAAGGVSDGDKTDITVSNSGATWNIDSGAVTTTEILDNTITASDLAATLTFGSADFIDLSAVVTTTGVDSGLAVPDYGNYVPASTKNFVTYDAANNALMVYEAGGWVNASAGSGAATSLKFITYQAEGSLSAENVLTEGLAIDIAAAGTDGGNVSVAFDPTELTGARTWAAGGDATIAWTYNVSTGTDPVITFGNNYVNVSTGALQVGGAAVYSVGGTDVALADGGTGASLSDPNADRVMFWDDSESAVAFLTLDTNHFSYSAATLSIGTDTIDDTLIDWGTGAAQVSMDDVPDGSSYQKVAAADVDASNHVNLIQDSDGTGAFQFTGSASATRAITLVDADQTLMNLGSAQNVSGDKEIQDNVALSFGNDNDWEVAYDETTSDALEFTHTAGAGADVTFDLNDNAAASTFSIINSDGTYAANLSVDGNITTAGTITSTASGASYLELANNSGGLAPSGYRLYFETDSVDVLSYSLNGSEKRVANLGDAQTLAGVKTFTGGIYAGDASNAGVFRLYDGSSNYWTIAAPAMSSNYTLTLPADDGSNGQTLITNGSGVLSWGSAGSGTAAGSDTQIQFNDGGSAFGGDAGFVFNKTTDAVTIGEDGVDGTLTLYNESGATDYNLILQPGTQSAAATITFPGSTSTLATLGLSETFSGTKTFSAAPIPSAATIDIGTTAAEWRNLFLTDGGIIELGADQDVTLTHIADTGVRINAAMALQFRDSALSIASANDGHLDLTADTSIDLNGYVVASSSMGITGKLDVTGAITGASFTPNRAAGSAAQYIELYEAYDSAGDESIKLQAKDMAADLTIYLWDAYPAGNNYLVNMDTDGTLGFTDPSSLGAGSVAWSAIGDPDADATVAFAGYEQDITSTLDEASHSVLTITNTDADRANDTTILELADYDSADANAFFLKLTNDADGTPSTLLSISETTVLSGALAWDLGGATSIELPNGANPTTDAAGEMAVDTSSGAGGGVLVYTDGAYTLPVYKSISFTIKGCTATDDFALWEVPYNITLRAVKYLKVGGTNWVGQMQETDSAGANGADTQSSDSTVTGQTDVTSFSNATLDAGDYLAIKTTSVSGTNTYLTITVDYTVDAVN